MIVHTIAFRFRADDVAGRRALAEQFRDRLAPLESAVEQVRSLHLAIDLGLVEDHFDLVLTSTHDSYADLEAYQGHPLHQEVAAFGRTVVADRACVDYEVPPY